MPKRTSDYHIGLRERLTNPEIAASYLRSAMQESREMFFIALRNVAQAGQMSSVAKRSELNRESLYRMLSNKGNPTYDSLDSLLKTVGLRLSVEPITSAASSGNTPSNQGIEQSPPTLGGLEKKASTFPSFGGISHESGFTIRTLERIGRSISAAHPVLGPSAVAPICGRQAKRQSVETSGRFANA